MGHETSRHATAAGEAAPTRDPVVAKRHAPVGRSPLARRVQELCVPVGPRLRTARREQASAHPDPWAAASVVPRTESEAGDPDAARAPGTRIPDRSLDAPTHRAPNRARHPTSTTSTSTTGSPRSTPSWCRPNAGASRCTSGSARGISRGWMSGASCGTCCSTCGARWPCSGTGARSIGTEWCRSSFATGRESSGTTSLHTPRSSTRRSMSGPKPMPRCPTPPPRTWWISKRGSDPQFAGPERLRSFSGPASMLPIYHGRDEESFLYVCDTH